MPGEHFLQGILKKDHAAEDEIEGILYKSLLHFIHIIYQFTLLTKMKSKENLDLALLNFCLINKSCFRSTALLLNFLSNSLTLEWLTFQIVFLLKLSLKNSNYLTVNSGISAYSLPYPHLTQHGTDYMLITEEAILIIGSHKGSACATFEVRRVL